MPQAMPLNWMELFMLFSLIFIILNIKMYYTNQSKLMKKNNSFIKNNYWKW